MIDHRVEWKIDKFNNAQWIEGSGVCLYEFFAWTGEDYVWRYVS